MGYHEAYKKAEEEMKQWEKNRWSKPTFEQEYSGMPGDYYGRYGKEATEQKDKQVGGDHYKMAIQPIDYITKNKIDYIEGNIIKYISRYKNKNGIEDLKKAQHYLEILIKNKEEEEND